MNIYYDSEFTGLHQASTLISLALVADDGHEFYAEFSDYDRAQCDDWIRDNVLNHTRWLQDSGAQAGRWEEGALTLYYGDREIIRQALIGWLARYEHVEIWAEAPAWDWVLFCELFGGAFEIPRQIYYLPFDLVTLFKARGLDPDIDREAFAGRIVNNGGGQRHNALYDARLSRDCHRKLITTPQQPRQ